MHDVYPLLEHSDFPLIKRGSLTTVQVNLGYKCNQSCTHCHVNAGPKRKEEMSKSVMIDILKFIDRFSIVNVDLTGGAPELNKNFKFFIKELKNRNCHIIDRCNLTIILEKSMSGLADFLKQNEVEIIASLPCYIQENVDKQRGKDVFGKSIKALKLLNKIGYGLSPSLKLNLVYNPQGPSLPPDQLKLSRDYKEFLKDKFDIRFHNLFTITNMPIARFGSTLISKNKFSEYMNLLKNSFNMNNLKELMCKKLISIDYQGYTYDCDFNQMLDMHLGAYKNKIYINDIKSDLYKKHIKTADHCFGCTAGAGSSCGGTLTSKL